MSGGVGNDTFIFRTTLGSANVDRITDFVSGSDVIHLDDAVFVALQAGLLSDTAFSANLTGQATSADHRIIYETDTGRLFYDADGSDIGARVQFAVLGRDLALSSSDFFVF